MVFCILMDLFLLISQKRNNASRKSNADFVNGIFDYYFIVFFADNYQIKVTFMGIFAFVLYRILHDLPC
jgi:hypothetical protein